MSKTTKRRPLIDRSRMSDRHLRAAARIAQMQDQLAIDLHQDAERIRNAVKAAFDDAMHACEDDELKASIFTLLCDAAKASDARLIAQHPECPAEVNASVESRTARAVTPATPTAPTAPAAKAARPNDGSEARPEG